VNVEQVRTWVAKGELKIVDGFVTERAFQAFCKKCAPGLNGALLGGEVRDWLMEGYALRLAEKDAVSVPPDERHALVTRECPKCRRSIRGNAFFRHVKSCKGMMSGKKGALRAPVLRPDVEYTSGATG
jgi:hypothetical protein